MTNNIRGETSAKFDGVSRPLCLTLGALASLEAKFQSDDLIALIERLQSGRIKSSDLIAILHAGLNGAGGTFREDEVAAMQINGGVEGAVAVVANLLKATFPESNRN